MTPAELFYLEVAAILDVPCVEVVEPKRRTRWNARQPGNGRYPGRGLVRAFGDRVLVQLRVPPVTRWFETRRKALEFLRQLRSTER
jgi:hypothetical protein